MMAGPKGLSMSHRFTPATRRFIDCPALEQPLAPRDHVIFGAAHGTPYPATSDMGYDVATGSSTAPQAIRDAATQNSSLLSNYDFDLGGPLLNEGQHGLFDAGDLALDPLDRPANRAAIAAATREIVAAGAVPVMIGGDDSVPIPFLAGFAGTRVNILQIDAHIDWRDTVGGEKFGYSSTMRRASEQGHVGSITQVGMRGVGSAGPAEVRAALDWGAKLVTVEKARALGPQGVAGLIPSGAPLIIQIDLDAFDPSVCAAVNAPSPGGFSFAELTAILKAAIQAHGLAGLSVVELVPARDADLRSANAAARVICNAIGWSVRQG